MVSILLSPIVANRVNVNHHTDIGALESKSGVHFFNSCHDLQTMFRTRVENIRTLQEAHPDESTFGATTRARFMMRTFGAVRILRRAKDCPWVVDGNTDDMDHVEEVARFALAGNPCGGAALKALASPAPAEDALQPLQQAVYIIFSDNCEVPSEILQTEAIDDDDLPNRVTAAEDDAQVTIEDLMDAAAAEGDDIASGSFLQTEGIFLWVAQTIAAVFLGILYLLSCTTLASLLLGFFLYIIAAIPCSIAAPGPSALGCLIFPMGGAALGVAAGVISCGYQLANGTASYDTISVLDHGEQSLRSRASSVVNTIAVSLQP